MQEADLTEHAYDWKKTNLKSRLTHLSDSITIIDALQWTATVSYLTFITSLATNVMFSVVLVCLSLSVCL